MTRSQRPADAAVKPQIPTDIRQADVGDAPTVRNLMHLYLYDMSEFEPRDVDSEGAFRYRYLDDYWSQPSRSILLLRCGGLPAGFAMVNEHSVLAAGGGIRTIAEFFVLRGLRRLGLGASLAIEAFRRFPGRWEVREMASNRPAIAFWRKVIGEYTAGRFVELELDDQRWKGPVQTFDNSLMVG